MNQSPQLILVTGAANSGKSEWAEYLAKKNPSGLIYIATAQKNESDEEWMRKIEQHRQRRSSNWQTWEIPQELLSAVVELPTDSTVLIDSLGTWVANCLATEENIWQEVCLTLIENLRHSEAKTVIIVAEETGWGVVPAYELGRIFRSRLGKLIRQVGVIADNVYLVVGGYAVDVSQIGVNIDRLSQ